MKLTISVLFLACVVLAAAIPAPREEGLQDLLTEIKDMVAGIEEHLAMEKRDQADEDEDLEAKAEDLQDLEMEKRRLNFSTYFACRRNCLRFDIVSERKVCYRNCIVYMPRISNN
ncbi:uncharacterized protein LOC144873660 [Branchiostoma floridae x Branchiostoma japonicum]